MKIKNLVQAITKRGGRIAKVVLTKANEHLPEICTVVGLGSMATAVVTAYKAGPVVKEKLKENPEMSTKEKVKTVASVCWPTAVSFVGGTVCIIYGNRVSRARYLATVATAAAAKKELVTLQDAIAAQFGPEDIEKLNQEIADRKVQNNPPEDEFIVKTGRGDVLFYEPYTGRYFRSTKQAIAEAANRLNDELLKNDMVSMNTWFDSIGLDSCNIGDLVFFSTQDGNARYDDFKIALRYFETHNPKTDELCWVLDYINKPLDIGL